MYVIICVRFVETVVGGGGGLGSQRKALRRSDCSRYCLRSRWQMKNALAVNFIFGSFGDYFKFLFFFFYFFISKSEERLDQFFPKAVTSLASNPIISMRQTRIALYYRNNRTIQYWNNYIMYNKIFYCFTYADRIAYIIICVRFILIYNFYNTSLIWQITASYKIYTINASYKQYSNDG